MDAVELPLPAVVAVSKLLNAEGFSKGAVSTVDEAEVRKTEVRSVIGTPPPINGWISSASSKDVSHVVITSDQDSTSRHRKADVGLSCDEKQRSNSQVESITEQCGSVNGSLFMLPKSAGKLCSRKAGKGESGSSCSKRQRIYQLEDTMKHDGIDGSNLTSEKPASNQAKCTFTEKGVAKQKHGHDGKRFKAKNKLNPSFPKGGPLSSNSVASGNNILGICGLKSDIHHVSKHVDELPLRKLLDGGYECPNLCQDIGKKVGTTNENLLDSVRKACSVLQPKRPVQSQNSFELDNSSNRKAPWLLISGSCGTSNMDLDKVDNNTTDLTSSSEIHNSCSKRGTSVSANNSSLLQPKDILERLALPPDKDLNSLLLDVAKPAVSSRSSTDLRPSKLTSKRVGLPPFSWSYSTSSKANADVGKPCTTRTTSQGRWVRIGSAAGFHGDARGGFSDLDSLSYNLSLVPSRGVKLGLSDDEKVPLACVKLPWHEPSLSTLRFNPASHIPEAEQDKKYQGNGDTLKGPSADNFLFQEQKNCAEKEQSKIKSEGDGANSCHSSPSKSFGGGCDGHLSNSLMPENLKQAVHSPRLLVAAQILCEISSDCRKLVQSNGKIGWNKKPAQKTMKTCKSKCSTGKAVLSVAAKSVTGSGDLVKVANQMTLTKPPKFSSADKKKDLDYTNNLGRGMLRWPTVPMPTSSTSSPSKLERAAVSDTKLLSSNMENVLGAKSFSAQAPEKGCNSHQKPRKPLTVDWGRGRCKKE